MNEMKICFRHAFYAFLLLCAAFRTAKEQMLFTPAVLLLCALAVLGRGFDEVEKLKNGARR